MAESVASGSEERTGTRLRTANWEHWMKIAGLRREKDVAAAMGISEVTLWRVRKGHARPGPKFVPAALRVFAPATYDDLFDNGRVPTVPTREYGSIYG